MTLKNKFTITDVCYWLLLYAAVISLVMWLQWRVQLWSAALTKNWSCPTEPCLVEAKHWCTPLTILQTLIEAAELDENFEVNQVQFSYINSAQTAN